MSDRRKRGSLGHFLHHCDIFRVCVKRISPLISVTVRRECERRAIESYAQFSAGANPDADAVVNLVLSFHAPSIVPLPHARRRARQALSVPNTAVLL